MLTFPSLGTFDSIWQRIEQEMIRMGSRPNGKVRGACGGAAIGEEARGWLERLEMERIAVVERPLEVTSGSGPRFLQHPLLRGGFLDDAYECFDDARLAEEVMTRVSLDVDSMRPLVAQRCASAAGSDKHNLQTPMITT